MRWNWPSDEAIFGSPFDPGVGSSALHRETIPIAFHHLAEKIPARIRLTAEVEKNLSALSGVAYKKFRVIFPFLVAPNSAPNLGNAPLTIG
jgi:hypothetical protein